MAYVVAPISINRIRFSTRSLPKAAHRGSCRATVGLHRPIAQLQDRSRCQWAISITVAAERAGYRDGEEWTKSGAQRSPTCIWITEEFDKQWEIARKQGKLG